MLKFFRTAMAVCLFSINLIPSVGAEPLSDLSGLDHFAINVRDLDKSTKWYGDVFGFNVLRKWKSVTMVGRGNMKVGLFHRPEAVPVTDMDSKIAIAHVAFLIDGDKFDNTLDRVKQMGIAVEGPEDTGIAFSFFFNDPDGHLLEVTTYHGATPK